MRSTNEDRNNMITAIVCTSIILVLFFCYWVGRSMQEKMVDTRTPAEKLEGALKTLKQKRGY